ncbi:MAG: hypothetical protein IH942_09225 [Acidobacteria bacterium]|nr:hypothetical protein [Acidobacteriota bacterium]
MAESLRVHAQDLAYYLSAHVLDHDDLSSADILDALASLGITLVEDPVSDSTHSYYESLLRLGEERGPGDA